MTKYLVNIFSLRNQEQFLEFLDNVEQEAHPIHLTTVTEVYGKDWAQPYMSLIVDRRRRAREEG